ncbi:TatD family hydrolase, partial [Francisella tularensis subsp. holarctica]|uniref:TatD family hydrolase n=1 Tax=Francisella tularensis TaxID=263 RepID=UPI0023819728
IAEDYSDVYFSVGVHPCDLVTHHPSVDEIIVRSQHQNCVAIGETGLDYYYNSSDTKKAKIDKFAKQIQAANQGNTPVV